MKLVLVLISSGNEFGTVAEFGVISILGRDVWFTVGDGGDFVGGKNVYVVFEVSVTVSMLLEKTIVEVLVLVLESLFEIVLECLLGMVLVLLLRIMLVILLMHNTIVADGFGIVVGYNDGWVVEECVGLINHW